MSEKKDRPRFRIALKIDGVHTPVAAWWDGAKGFTGGLDRRVVALAVKLDDGSVVRLRRGADGKTLGYVNLYENRDDAPAARPAVGQADLSIPSDDDIPF